MPQDTIRNRFVIFAKYFLVFLAFFWILSECIIGSDWMFDTLDPLRPTFVGADMPTHVQKQIFHIERLSRENDSQARIIFVGSSSVVNGVDVTRVKQVFLKENINFRPLNYGAVALSAYELPFFKKILLDKKNKWVIYLYNTFSFGDTLHPQAIRVRWNTSEALELLNRNDIGLAAMAHFSSGILSEVFTLIRYSNFYEECFRRFVSNRLEPIPYEWDFPPDSPATTIKELSIPTEPAPPEDFMRSLYLDSFLKDKTIGYAGLDRFLKLANQAGVKVIIAPIPEPDIAVMYPWKSGIDERVVDEKVRAIAGNNDAYFIPRMEIEYIEKQPSYFRDYVHANWVGRNEYSDWLAKRLVNVITR